jgi:protein AATF/BFR2
MSFLKELADLQESRPADIDPADLGDFGDGTVADAASMSASTDITASNLGMGRASLREQGALNDLAARYPGRTVSRAEAMGNAGSESEEEAADPFVSGSSEDEAEPAGAAFEARSDAEESGEESESRGRGDKSFTAEKRTAFSDEIEERLASLRAEDSKALLGLKGDGEDRVAKAAHARNQRALWESILELRIKMQGALSCANRLPMPDVHNVLCRSGVRSDEVQKAFDGASHAVAAQLRSMMALQRRLLRRLPAAEGTETGDCVDEGEGSSEDEHSSASERSSAASGTEPIGATDGMMHTRDIAADEDAEASDAEAREEASSAKGSDSPRRPIDVDALWETLDGRWTNRVLPYVSKVVDHYGRKVQLQAAGGVHKKKLELTAFNRTITAQVQAVRQDGPRLLKRTRKRRGANAKKRIIGESPAAFKAMKRAQKRGRSELDVSAGETEADAEARREALALAEEIFDDGDFYGDLLRELIESEGAGQSGGLDASGRQRLPRKRYKSVKKDVDRRASKGRKVRYITHPKLLNFMAAAAELPTGLDVARLFLGLFGQRKVRS